MTIRKIRRRVASSVVAAFLMSLGAATALGHAELDKATPADQSTVEAPPTEILMTFTEALDPAKSSIKLVDGSGAVIADGSTVSSGNPKLMRLAIGTVLAPAPYTVRWTTASAVDGDVDHGTTSFTVAAAASVAPSASTASTAPTASSSAAASVAPASVSPSVTPSPSSPPTTPATSTNDAVIPVIVALIVLVGLGAWLIRSRARAR